MHTLSPYQRDTMPSLDRTRALAARLAGVIGVPVAVLKQGPLYWTACPADLVEYWRADIDGGRVAIVETVGKAVTR